MSSFGERAMQLAHGAAALLGWRPAEFWESTPAELSAALGIGIDDGEMMHRSEVDRLLALFPDKRET